MGFLLCQGNDFGVCVGRGGGLCVFSNYDKKPLEVLIRGVMQSN